VPIKRSSRKRKKKMKISPFIFFAIIFVVLILVFYLVFQSLLFPSILTIPELSTLGYTEVIVGINVTDEMGIVYLTGDCYEISMVIDRAQGISIENGINRIIGSRPNTHDLLKDLLKGLDVEVLMIKVTELKNNTFFARLILRKGNFILSLDSRPSDTLATAARTDYAVPIYVNETMLKSIGRKVC